MNPVKKILFPTDFSEASHYALAYAVEIGRASCRERVFRAV